MKENNNQFLIIGTAEQRIGLIQILTTLFKDPSIVHEVDMDITIILKKIKQLCIGVKGSMRIDNLRICFPNPASNHELQQQYINYIDQIKEAGKWHKGRMEITGYTHFQYIITDNNYDNVSDLWSKYLICPQTEEDIKELMSLLDQHYSIAINCDDELKDLIRNEANRSFVNKSMSETIRIYSNFNTRFNVRCLVIHERPTEHEAVDQFLSKLSECEESLLGDICILITDTPKQYEEYSKLPDYIQIVPRNELQSFLRKQCDKDAEDIFNSLGYG
ncbi:MAG: hypothetical protein M3Q64_00365 [bacterium]|nr:hypothetical protein [bacterium]